jgi:urea transport system permease protein
VYFSIITQAMALILSVLIIGQQGYRRRQRHHRPQDPDGLGHPHRQRQVVLYFVCVALLFGCICWPLRPAKLGTLLVAMRDKEDRCASPAMTWPASRSSCSARRRVVGHRRGLFTLQVGFMSPSFVGIVPSIEMVIYAAVGGRMSLVGAVYGTLLVNAARPISRAFPDLWLFLMAACSSA